MIEDRLDEKAGGKAVGIDAAVNDFSIIPASATRFRSVMDIMVSNQVLFKILLETCRLNSYPSPEKRFGIALQSKF